MKKTTPFLIIICTIIFLSSCDNFLQRKEAELLQGGWQQLFEDGESVTYVLMPDFKIHTYRIFSDDAYQIWEYYTIHPEQQLISWKQGLYRYEISDDKGDRYLYLYEQNNPMGPGSEPNYCLKWIGIENIEQYLITTKECKSWLLHNNTRYSMRIRKAMDFRKTWSMIEQERDLEPGEKYTITVAFASEIQLSYDYCVLFQTEHENLDEQTLKYIMDQKNIIHDAQVDYRNGIITEPEYSSVINDLYMYASTIYAELIVSSESDTIVFSERFDIP